MYPVLRTIRIHLPSLIDKRKYPTYLEHPKEGLHVFSDSHGHCALVAR